MLAVEKSQYQPPVRDTCSMNSVDTNWVNSGGASFVIVFCNLVFQMTQRAFKHLSRPLGARQTARSYETVSSKQQKRLTHPPWRRLAPAYALARRLIWR